MKNLWVFVAMLPLALAFVAEAEVVEWQKCLGGSYEDYAYSIQQTRDGGYIIAGVPTLTMATWTGFTGSKTPGLSSSTPTVTSPAVVTSPVAGATLVWAWER
ncbi:MAG: hypothetical protein LBD04_08725 [Synergistaceae bacterium]|nr:hypothetical protein [Synergistaceae bacterium]